MHKIPVPGTTSHFEYDEITGLATLQSYGSARKATETELALIKFAVGGGGLPAPAPQPKPETTTAVVRSPATPKPSAGGQDKE